MGELVPLSPACLWCLLPSSMLRVMHDMQDFLIQRMELGATREAAERCERYLADDPIVISRRQELTVHKEKLEKVKAKLYSFGI